MKEIKENELNTVNGGMGLGGDTAGMLGGSKFNEGDMVMSKSQPDMGVGTVTGKKYCRGWHYYVQPVKGGKMYVPENDLEPALLQN